MRAFLFCFFWIIFFTPWVNGQNSISGPDVSKKQGSTLPSQKMTVVCKGGVHPPGIDLKWRPILNKKFIESEPMERDHELIEKIKREKQKLKTNAANTAQNRSAEPSTQSTSPVLGVNYPGNNNNGMSPLDNSLAISDGGRIVSVANFTIEYDDMLGSTLYYNTLLNLVNVVDASITAVCDPVVHYDSGSDRFICFCQSSPLSTANKIFILFSQSNDPNVDGWWIYELNGDPAGNGDAFDYPKLAVSTNELFITGNLYTAPAGNNNGSVIFQLDKLAGYSGSSLNFLYYTNIAGSPFTLLPVSNGQTGNYGPGIYLVSTSSAGSASINFYHISNAMCCSPVLNYWTVATTPYSVGADADQLGTTCQLKTGDCRTLSGFYLNNGSTETVHFVFHSDIGSGWHGINYNRLDINSLTNTSSTFGMSGTYDYCFPSVVSYGTSPSDNSVMIGFGRSGLSIYPEVRVVNCDNSMNWSGSTLVKASQNYVSYTSSTAERWGDYIGTTRKHNSAFPSIWLNGMFGNSTNQWDTWNAEIHDNAVGIKNNSQSKPVKLYPNPVVETFSLEFDMKESAAIEISLTHVDGKLVKLLFRGEGKAGENVFSFNKSNLSAGTYFLSIKSNSNILKNEKIIIAD